MFTIPGGQLAVMVVGSGPTAWCASIAVARSGLSVVLAVPGSRPVITASPTEDQQSIALLSSWGVSSRRAQDWGEALMVATLDSPRCEVWSGVVPAGSAHDGPAVHGPALALLVDASGQEWRVATGVLVNTGPDAQGCDLKEAVRRGAALAETARSLVAGSATARATTAAA